jgi:predicted O-methyltransferase YrrM
MEHFYKTINSEDWFNFQNIYSNVVNKFDNNSHFVEVGSWKGMSACYMAVEIINSGKNIKFDCVDTWDYVESSSEIEKSEFDNLFEVFNSNIEPVKDVINIIKSLSWDGAKNYEDNSLDFIFIDAGHDYESVTKDITNWFPKLKIGGLIAGHDYHHLPVNKAVNDFFGESNIIIDSSSWLFNK